MAVPELSLARLLISLGLCSFLCLTLLPQLFTIAFREGAKGFVNFLTNPALLACLLLRFFAVVTLRLVIFRERSLRTFWLLSLLCGVTSLQPLIRVMLPGPGLITSTRTPTGFPSSTEGNQQSLLASQTSNAEPGA